MDWLDLLAVQETLKSLLQHHSLKASILRCSAFFTVQLSHLYMTTGKTIALAIWTFVSKVTSVQFSSVQFSSVAQSCPTLCDPMNHLLTKMIFNTLSSFVIAFLQRVKCLFISWLQSPFTVILKTKKIKSVTASTFSSSICHEMTLTVPSHYFLNPVSKVFVFSSKGAM